jgi:hypothetical protein
VSVARFAISVYAPKIEISLFHSRTTAATTPADDGRDEVFICKPKKIVLILFA